MLSDVELWEEHIVLRAQADGLANLRHICSQFVPTDICVPCARGDQTGQHGYRRSLARAVVAQ